MYKQITLLTVLSVSYLVCFSQSQKIMFTSESAGELHALVEENSKDDSATMKNVKNHQRFYAIFKEYGMYEEISDSILLKNNPFITKDLLIDIKPLKQLVSDTLENNGENLFEGKLDEVVVAGLGTSIGSVAWQTAVLDGTAKFLAQRFKEEIAAYYINTFYGKIDDKPVVKALFPNTVGFLRVFANQVYNTDIATLQAAAEEDLKNFPANLIDALNFIEVFKNNPLLKSGVSLGLDIYKQSKAGLGVADIINDLPYKSYVNDGYKPYLSVLRILLNSVRTSEPSRDAGPWEDLEEVDFSDFTNFEDPYYYALLYEQLKNVSFNGKTLKGCFAAKTDWVTWFHSVISYFRQVKSLNDYLTEQKRNARTKTPDFWESLTKITALINEGFPVIDKIPDSLVKIHVSIRNVAENTQSLLLIIKKVQDKQYEQIVPNLIILLTKLDSRISNDQVVPYMRYAGVIAQFASVKTADDMKDLLQSIALPIGSASIKRKSKWNISLNAYVGVAVGNERAKENDLTQEKVSIGLTAPIGIAISKQYRGVKESLSKGKSPFIPSGTFYISFFDIGNLVNVRLKSDTTSIGEVRFSHFVSLGAGYYVNFRNSPLSAGFSWSYVPGYRDVFVDNKWLYKADVMRFRLSLKVDIPIFNFYNKPID